MIAISKLSALGKGGYGVVSVIIPAYNCENYLTDCIESIIMQSYKELEIVIVDDGSNEATARLCDKLANRDKRIVVLHKSNGGVSSARNAGIEAAHGEYIVFVDADDTLDNNIIYEAVMKSEQHKLSYWGYRIIGRTGQYENVPDLDLNLDRDELIANALFTLNRGYTVGTYFRAVWGKLFDAEIIKEHNIRFPENLYLGEDAFFLIKYLMYVNGINVICRSGYNYRISQTSAVRRYKEDIYQQCCNQLNAALDIFVRYNFSEENIMSIAFSNFKWMLYVTVLENSKTGLKTGKVRLLSLFNESNKWLKENYTVMEQKPVEANEIDSRYRSLYKLIPNTGYTVIGVTYFLSEIFRKIGKRIGL